MLERALENWLTNTNERNFQFPFCQALTSLGYEVLLVSTHGQMEQGKDVIAVNSTGSICAYQLKTGDIGLAEWRKIKGEVLELMELPCVHSSIDPNAMHGAFLVTNGRVTDPVRHQIVLINQDNERKERGYAHLEVIARDQLLGILIDAQENVLPLELEDFDTFFKLYSSDGTGFFKKDLFAKFLQRTFIEQRFKQKSDKIHAYSGSIVLTALLLDKFQRVNNHYSQFEAWVMLRAFLRWLSVCWTLPDQFVERTLGWLDSQVAWHLTSLKREVLARKDFFEGDIVGDGGPVYSMRKWLVLGSIAAFELYSGRVDKNYSIDSEVLTVIRESLPLGFVCESMIPHLLSIMWLFEKVDDVNIAPIIPEFMLAEIMNLNSPDQRFGLSNPYYAPEDVLQAGLTGDIERVDFSEFPGSSWGLEAVVHTLVRRDRRDILEENWKKLSHIGMQSFHPDCADDYWLWRVGEGVTRTDFLRTPESWRRLQTVASTSDDIPDPIRNDLPFLQLFLLVFPHRCSSLAVKALDL